MDVVITTPIELDITAQELQNIVNKDIHEKDAITGEPCKYSLSFRIDDFQNRLKTKTPSQIAKQKGKNNIQTFIDMVKSKFPQNTPNIVVQQDADINCNVSVNFS